MNQTTSFKIFNSSNAEMEIIHEPEGFQFNLQANEEAVIETDVCLESVQLRAFYEKTERL